MAMEKRGVSTKSIDIIGASSEDGAYICEDCKKIVITKQMKEKGKCPFCNSYKLKNS